MLEYATRHPPLLLVFHCFKNVNSVYAIAPPLVTCALGALRGTKWTITTILCLLFTFVRGAARGRERCKKKTSFVSPSERATRETFEPKDLRKKKNDERLSRCELHSRRIYRRDDRGRPCLSA